MIRKKIKSVISRNGKLENIEKSLKLAKKLYERNLQLFNDLCNTSSDIVSIIDRKGTIKDLNRTGQRILKIKKKEALGKSILDFHPPEWRKVCQEKISDAFKGKKNVRCICPYMDTTKNALFNFKTITKFNLQKDGNITLIVSNLKDISEIMKTQKKLEDTYRNLQVTKKDLDKYGRELEKRTREIDLFNKVLVDRELKMIELKKKIKMLEEGRKYGGRTQGAFSR